MITRVYINHENIQFNLDNPDAPPRPRLRIRRGILTFSGNEMEINGLVRVCYDPSAKLPCNCVPWIETEAPFKFSQ